MGRRKEEEEERVPVWMLSFSDMIQQILCFFVILFSMSTLDKTKAQVAAQSFVEATEGKPSGEIEETRDLIQRFIQLEKIVLTPQGTRRPGPRGTYTQVQKVDEGFKITIQGKALFEEGDYKLNNDADTQALMMDVLKLVHGGYNILEIRGHTSALVADALPDIDPGGVSTPNHWLLSYKRAESVMKWLTTAHKDLADYAKKGFEPLPIEQFRLQGNGYAEASADTQAELRWLNRRVEIIVTQQLYKPRR